MKKFLIGAGLVLLSAGCSETGSEQEIEMKNGDGNSVGVATLSECDAAGGLRLDLQGLPLEDQAINIREKATCEAPVFQ